MIKIVLADDHPVVRQGLRAVFEAEADFAVAGETGDGLEAVQLVEELGPDVVVLDVMMPGLNGLEVARQVVRRRPQTRIVILSMHANDAYVLEALRHGAAAYVLKGSAPGELVRAVREVAAGRHYLSPPLSERAIEAYRSQAQGQTLEPYDTLTTREREVLHLAAEGRQNADIAERLGISPRTAETHRTHIMRKLGLHSQTELVRYALRRGIIAMES
jgi:DNA-binding NarL/FixJ family response regulator